MKQKHGCKQILRSERKVNIGVREANQAENYKEQLGFVKWRKDYHLR